MSVRIPLYVALTVLLTALNMAPVFSQSEEGAPEQSPRNDRAAIHRLLGTYEAAFDNRNIDARMALCLGTYEEIGFEGGEFVFAKNYDQTRIDEGNYWESLPSLVYTIDDYDVTIDGPMAFVTAHATHRAPGDNHVSVVYFSLVKIDRRWWIASDSYNIIRRLD